MHSVVLVIPFFTDFAVRVIETSGSLPDVRLGVISQQPQEELAPPVRAKIESHWRVDDALDADQLVYSAQMLMRNLGPLHRLFGPAEHAQTPVAVARERLGIPGMSAETARNFRDKARMKDLLRAAGLPCARHRLVHDAEEAEAFAQEAGFPVIVKPPEGAAAQSTFRVDDANALREALRQLAPTPREAIVLEEFVTGEEHSFDTFSLNGRHLFHSLTHYLPSPLDVIRNPWIQWTVLLPREIDDERYDDIRAIAPRALDVLGMSTGFSHLEWFRRPDGSALISEVAARPPGAQFTTLISRANDFDALAAWLRLMVCGEFKPPVRRYAVGCAYLRGQGHGKVVGVRGLDDAWSAVGPLVSDVRLPQIGQPASSTYEGEGYMVVRHPETEVVREALKLIISSVCVELG